MPKDRDSRALRIFRWFWDKALDNWLAVLFIGGSGTAMTYLAAVTDFLNAYAPLSWGAVGIFSALIVSLAMALYGVFRSRFALAKFQESRSEAVEINPLSESFSRKRIRLFDFYHPFFKSTHAARFQDCELFGPAIVLLQGCKVFVGAFRECDFVIVKGGGKTRTAIAFTDCIFERCDFYRVLFLVTEDEYSHTYSYLPGEINILSPDAHVPRKADA